MKETRTGYSVEVDSQGCNACGANRTWMVIDPEGVGGGVSYLDEDDAIEMAEILDSAYQRGKASGQKFCLHGPREQCSDETYCWGTGGQ